MTREEFLDQFFTPKKLNKYITSYILYYQLSLGYNVYESLHDMEAAQEKLKELNLSLEHNQVIIDIFLLSLDRLELNSDIFNNINSLIQQQALLHSLHDFIQNDQELLNKESYQAMKTQQILDNTFLTSTMKMQFLDEYSKMYNQHKNTIDETYTQEVKEILIKSFMN